MPGIIGSRPWLRRWASIATWLSIAAIVVLSWIPRGAVPRTGAPGPLEHVMVYGVTGVLAALAGRPRQTRWFGLAFVALAAVLEIGQIWVPGRVSQFGDFAAGSAGAVVGLALASGLTSRALDRRAGPDLPVRRDAISRSLLLGLVALGVLVTPIGVGFLVGVVGSCLAWLLG